MEQNEILSKILSELAELKGRLSNHNSLTSATDKWIPLKVVKDFLNYGPTQMASLLKEGSLIASSIGKRKFILRKSLEDFLDSKTITT